MFAPRILALMAAGAAILPAAAFAAPADDTMLTRQVHVQTADLNLSSTAGRRALQARVQRAANSVCGADEAGMQVGRHEAARCRAVALTDARTQLDKVTGTAPRFAQATPADAHTDTANGGS